MTQLNFSTNRVISVTGNYTPTLYEDIILVTTAGDTTITLPAVASAHNKAYYILKASAISKVIVTPQTGELIDGSDHYDINNHYECIQIVCNGSAWYVISKK